MDKEEQERVRVVVEEILAEADIEQVSEKQVRELASKKTGINLSASRESRKLVRSVIEQFMESGIEAPDAEAAEKSKALPEQDNRKSSKKVRNNLPNTFFLVEM